MNSEININSDKKQNDVSLIKTKKTVRARTLKQNEYILALNKSELTFGVDLQEQEKHFYQWSMR